MLQKLLLGIVLVFLGILPAIAQQKTVSGRITDSQGNGVPGVTVTVKGSRTATQTAADGSYSLSTPETATLVFTSVGYTSQQVSVTGKTTVDASLATANSNLNEVVVIGYGTVRKKDLTGAVSQVQAKDFNTGFVTSPDQLIQGKVPGLEITNNSGAPGGATTIKIRGNSSPRAGAGQPLYVIDGVPLDGRNARPALGSGSTGFGNLPDINPLLFINADDIASVEVLKDASATAIYGSRGSDGVILYTTKRGKPGETKLDVSYATGFSELMRKYDLLSSGEYKAALSKYGVTGQDAGGNVDPIDAITRKGFSQKANVAISGGGENNYYRLSLGYINTEGIILKSDLKKYMANFSGQAKVLKRIKIDYSVALAHTNEEVAPISNDAGYTGNMVGSALGWNPTRSFYATDSLSTAYYHGFYQPGTGAILNPLALSAATHDNPQITDIRAYVAPSINLFKGLDYKFLYSLDYQNGTRRFSVDDWLASTQTYKLGDGFYGNNELFTQLIQHTLNYNTSLTSKLDLTALAGFEYQKFVYQGVSTNGLGFAFGNLDYTNILQNAATPAIGSFKDPTSELQSYFGRAILNYNDRYLLTATLRADGSTKFGSNHKYGYFPSFAGKWNISNESFMKNIRFFDNLALRGGYGVTGSQEFPSAASLKVYTIGQGGNTKLSNLDNPDLKWEQTRQYDIGLDFSILSHRVTGVIDYFHRNTTDLLFQLPVPLPGPATTFWGNLPMNVYNKGVEIGLDADIVRTKDWTWSVGGQVTFLKNDVENYNGPDIPTGFLSGQGLSGVNAQLISKITNGHPLDSWYLPVFNGFGKDSNSTYKTSNTTNFVGSDPNPKTLLGLKTSVSYKQFYLSVAAHGNFGADIYNENANAFNFLGNIKQYNLNPRYIGDGEGINNPLQQSTRFLESGDFLKIDNVTLKYSLGNIKNSPIKNANIFIQVTNLHCFTKYSGFDPEVNVDKKVGSAASLGIDYSAYPTSRSYLLGLSFSL